MSIHGTTRGYAKGCHCVDCRVTYAVCEQVRQAKRAEHKVLRRNHGTNSRYLKGCRCAECRTAYAAGKQSRRTRRALEKVTEHMAIREREAGFSFGGSADHAYSPPIPTEKEGYYSCLDASGREEAMAKTLGWRRLIQGP